MKKKILDILLLPKSFYERLTDKRAFLYIGILLVGIRDMAMWIFAGNTGVFIDKSQPELLRNIAVLAMFIIVIGAIDVLFFSLPVFDVFKYFYKRTGVLIDGRGLIKVLKIYIIANLLVTPVNAVTYILAPEITHLLAETTTLAIVLLILIWGSIIWFNGVIVRGLLMVFRFNERLKGIVFAGVFIWGYMLSTALDYIFHRVVGVLLK
ncbi:MAG: hypothetical protein N2645_21055 [Clostridia bacterium]|nr:hypothetical protein [Clostridia bacterium]